MVFKNHNTRFDNLETRIYASKKYLSHPSSIPSNTTLFNDIAKKIYHRSLSAKNIIRSVSESLDPFTSNTFSEGMKIVKNFLLKLNSPVQLTSTCKLFDRNNPRLLKCVLS